MAILIAIELNVTAGSLQVESVGNDQVHKRSIACTEAKLYGGFCTAAQIFFDT